MNSIFLRWGVPALVTVVGGTIAAIMTTGANMASDLEARGSSALSRDFEWANVRFDARDATISGTATDQQVIDAAVARVAALHGVRSVSSDVILAEFVSPFPFEASVTNGQLSLSGGVPDETAHAEIVLRSGATGDHLRLMSGAPQRATWAAAVNYALANAAELDEGEVKLADLTLSISGRAKSPKAFDTLVGLQHAGAPDGVTIARAEFIPALAAPFEWKASFDGSKVSITGFKPNEEFVDRLRIADLNGRPVSTSLVLASGAPQGFDDNAVLLLQNLLQLERGEATISDDAMTLTGTPSDVKTVETVRLAMTPAGVGVTLDPPKIAEYQFAATKSGAGIVLDGFVPDAATKSRLEELDGVDAAGLELARGTPERFESGVEFGIEALRHMSEGRFTIRGSSLTLEGRAATLADYSTLKTTISLGAPQGLILATTDISAPIASPFTWKAERNAGGAINLSGYVTGEDSRNALHEAAPIGADATSIADGEPDNFEALTLKALAVLQLLDSGKVVFDGATWSIDGAVDTAEKGSTANTAFIVAGLSAAGWSYDVSVPKPAEAAPLPIIDPYVWRAQKAVDGSISFAGFVPTDAFKSFLARRVGDKLTDNSALGAGAPDGFIGATLAGLDALMRLNEGSLGFAGGVWSLTGQTGDSTQRIAIQDALDAAIDSSKWQVAIQAKNAAPVVTPFTWSAIKGDDGKVTLSGYLTTDELRRFVALRAGTVASDTTEVASGEPAGFMADVLAGLEALTHLRSGSVKFDGAKFSLDGVPQSAADSAAALAALDTATNGGAGWEKSISAPLVAPEPEPEPAIEPVPEPALVPEPEPAVDEPAAVVDPEVVAPDPAATSEPAVTPEPVIAPEPAVVPEVAIAPAPVARNFIFQAAKVRGEGMSLKGAVPADTTRKYFSVIAGDAPIEGMRVAQDLPRDFITNADIGIRTLAKLTDGELGLDGSQWVLTGRATSEGERTAALAGLSAVPSTGDWDLTVTLLPPIELCRDKVTAFASRNAIVFQSGSAKLTTESGEALDELAADLAICPATLVNIEGHTDADGDEALNLALSVARAEAVVEALIERGVAFQRLYAVGYGESLPIADNATRAGKQANRRIAFSILDQDQ